MRCARQFIRALPRAAAMQVADPVTGLPRPAFVALLGGTACVGVALCCLLPASVQAIECLSAPDQSDSGWWSWREIDGRKCWYRKDGAVPPKSEFRWGQRAEETPTTQAPAQQEQLSLQTTEGIAAPAPRIETVRVKPVEIGEPHYRLGEGRIGLFEGFDLSGARGIGRIWEVPASTDTFQARYGEWLER
jgi:hypothetical protein